MSSVWLEALREEMLEKLENENRVINTATSDSIVEYIVQNTFESDEMFVLLNVPHSLQALCELVNQLDYNIGDAIADYCFEHKHD